MLYDYYWPGNILELKNIDTRELLNKCYKKGVIFMPGDIFYINNEISALG